MTENTKERLERLATPRPDHFEPEVDAQLPTFAPRIHKMWKSDWRTRLLQHEVAHRNELIRWYKTTYPTAVGNGHKKEAQLFKEATRMLRPCPHGHGNTDTHHCNQCWSRLCKRCWKEPCRMKADLFREMPMYAQVQSITEAMKVPRWQAKAYLRNATPLPDRLAYSQERPAAEDISEPHASQVSDSLGEPRSQEEKDAARAPREARAPTPRPSMAPRWRSEREVQESFDRLAKPRDPKVFPDIPYLPELERFQSKMPDVKVLAGEGVSEGKGADEEQNFEALVDGLAEKEKIKTWQAGALKWCAKPVFERLYDASRVAAAAADRYQVVASPR